MQAEKDPVALMEDDPPRSMSDVLRPLGWWPAILTSMLAIVVAGMFLMAPRGKQFALSGTWE
jgi:hypothetical protein